MAKLPIVDTHLDQAENVTLFGLVMLMEGADPIVRVDDLPQWWERGLRMIGLTYGDTRYGAGVRGGSSTFRQGGLTAEGIRLIEYLADLGFI
jgi:microsomal dipeptidase-like Zn-dependent dipeptidase